MMVVIIFIGDKMMNKVIDFLDELSLSEFCIQGKGDFLVDGNEYSKIRIESGVFLPCNDLCCDECTGTQEEMDNCDGVPAIYFEFDDKKDVIVYYDDGELKICGYEE